MDALELVRPDLRGFAGYASARRTQATGRVWLNANESAVASPVDASGALNRYPDPQPPELRARLAAHYGVAPEALMVTRGSDEGIDLLVRAFCRAGRDAVAVATPCFGMYAVSARIQGAPLAEVMLEDDGDAWRLDLEVLATTVAMRGARLVFLASPANPTGQALPGEAVHALASRLSDRAIVVVDEAYGEYAGEPGAAAMLAELPNLVVLRTLSKAHALAGARIGALLAAPGLVALLRNLSAPYPLAAPSVALALAALAPDALATTRARCEATIAERGRVAEALRRTRGVGTVYPSDANFLLVRVADADAALARLLAAGVVVRDMRAMAGLGDALRITIGTPAENDAMLAALESGA